MLPHHLWTSICSSLLPSLISLSSKVRSFGHRVQILGYMRWSLKGNSIFTEESASQKLKGVSFRDVGPAPPRPREKWCLLPENFQDCPAPPYPENALSLTVNLPCPKDLLPAPHRPTPKNFSSAPPRPEAKKGRLYIPGIFLKVRPSKFAESALEIRQSVRKSARRDGEWDCVTWLKSNISGLHR